MEIPLYQAHVDVLCNTNGIISRSDDDDDAAAMQAICLGPSLNEARKVRPRRKPVSTTPRYCNCHNPSEPFSIARARSPSPSAHASYGRLAIAPHTNHA
jgi:hypothetical protein